MCTAISYRNGDHYFGRNLDLERGFHETVTITPRNYPFTFRSHECASTHHAMIGIATVVDGYPLYYEATNEYGLSIAGLNFPGNAVYYPPKIQKTNLAPYELIPWILGQYKTIEEIRSVLDNLNITNIPFSDSLPLSPLHWMISDKTDSLVLESTISGVNIYENPINILTNNPPFPYHKQNLENYLNLTSREPNNRFSNELKLNAYSRGMGAIGLPGDLSSASRFIRAAFALHNSVAEKNENENISQFFHILEMVSQTSGCVQVGAQYEKTLYSSCCDTQCGIYYYKTYNNSAITAIRMHAADLNSPALRCFPLRTTQEIRFEN